MPTKRSALGKEGEDFACEYLTKKGYEILERNFRKPWGELDIVARAPDRTLVFVEVKTMRDSGPEGLKPEDQMSPAKRKKFTRTAMLYAGSHENFMDDKKGWRMDVITLLKREEKFEVQHYENI
ncbi:MAG: YraN family protein [Patescibacteria group bacterium]